MGLLGFLGIILVLPKIAPESQYADRLGRLPSNYAPLSVSVSVSMNIHIYIYIYTGCSGSSLIYLIQPSYLVELHCLSVIVFQGV